MNNQNTADSKVKEYIQRAKQIHPQGKGVLRDTWRIEVMGVAQLLQQEEIHLEANRPPSEVFGEVEMCDYDEDEGTYFCEECGCNGKCICADS